MCGIWRRSVLLNDRFDQLTDQRGFTHTASRSEYGKTRLVSKDTRDEISALRVAVVMASTT